MNIHKWILETLRQDSRRNFTSFDVLRTMSNSSEGRSEIDMLRSQRSAGKGRSEREIITTFENKYRYVVATTLCQFNLKGYVTKEGQAYKITELGLQKLKELKEIY